MRLGRPLLTSLLSTGHPSLRLASGFAPPWSRAPRLFPAVMASSSSSATPSTPVTPVTPVGASVTGPSVSHTTFPEPTWHDLGTTPDQLRVTVTLATGQCFNWRAVKFAPSGAPEVGSGDADDLCWVGVLGGQVVAVRDGSGTTYFACLADSAASDGGASASMDDPARVAALAARLRDYFQLETDLTALYSEWSENDARLQAVAEALPGLRVVRQEPVECLFSFICSSNNNIQRIVLIMNKLRATHGAHLITLPIVPPALMEGDEAEAGAAGGGGGATTTTTTTTPTKGRGSKGATPKKATPGSATKTAAAAEVDQEFYTFPSLACLAGLHEQALRDLGLGYRGRFVCETAASLQEKGGEAWLTALRQAGRVECQKALLEFTGVGPKVADCVALFSLDQRGIIPVDVHVWQIAVRDFDPTLVEAKSLTPAIYDRVGDLFRDRYGSHAGWAHSLLFAAELPGFKTRLPIALQEEMAAFQEMEKQRKVELKEAKTARAKVASPKAAKPSAKVKAKAKVEAKVEAKVVVEATAEVGLGVTVKEEEEEEEEGAGPTAQKASAKGKAKAKAKVKAERDPEGPTSATKKRRT